MHRVDHRVSRQHDVGLGDALGAQQVDVVLGRRKMIGGELRDQPTVHLFRKRAERICRTQPGFHMPHRDATMEGGKASGQRRGRIALDQYEIRVVGRQHGVDCGNDLGKQLIKGLAGLHRVKIVIRADVEQP